MPAAEVVCAALLARRGSWRRVVSSSLSASSGLERDKFDNKTVSFEEHIKFEHNMWNYLYFIVLVRVKNKTDYTGPESYVAQMIKVWALGGVARATSTDREAGGDAGELWALVDRPGGEQSSCWSQPLGTPSPASCLCCRRSCLGSVVKKRPWQTHQPQRTGVVALGVGAWCCGGVAAGQTLLWPLLWATLREYVYCFWVTDVAHLQVAIQHIHCRLKDVFRGKKRVLCI